MTADDRLTDADLAAIEARSSVASLPYTTEATINAVGALVSTDVPRLVAFAKAVLALSHDPACHDDVECDCNVGNIRWLAAQHLGGDR